MGSLMIADQLARRGSPSSNLMLWVLLALAIVLTFWECRSRGYRAAVTLWWVCLTALVHAPAFLVLRFLVKPPHAGDGP